MSGGIKRYKGFRAWQACDRYKRAVYRLCAEGPISRDWSKRRQLEDSVAGPPAHIAEGFGRFNPPDFARFVVYARSSLMESQNHIADGVDKGYINQPMFISLSELAGVALKEVGGLLDYLQSPEALDNARRIRERRIASRKTRRQRKRQAPSESEASREQDTSAEPEGSRTEDAELGEPTLNENGERWTGPRTTNHAPENQEPQNPEPENPEPQNPRTLEP